MYPAKKEILTYDRAKELYAAGKVKAKNFDPERGVQLVGDSRIVRNKNNSFTVWHFSRSRRYGAKQIKVFTVTPADKWTIHGDFNTYWGQTGFDPVAAKRLLEYTPLGGHIFRGGSQHIHGISPQAKKKPGIPKGSEVPMPYYVTKSGDCRSRMASREQYEADLAKYGDGSLEEWHERHAVYDAKRRAHSDKVYEWEQESHVRAFDGMVIDAQGVVSQRSMSQNEARLRRLKREKEAEKRRQEEEKRKEQERRNRAFKSTQKLVKVELADPKVIEWLAGNGIKPNADGKTVNLVKNVGENFVSKHRVEYKIGTQVTAKDYNTTPDCVGGLFFAPSKGLIPANNGYGDKTIECECDLATMIVVTRGWPNGGKVKTKTCKVLREV